MYRPLDQKQYVNEKDKKVVMADLKSVSKAVNEEIGYENLLQFEKSGDQSNH